MSSGIGKVMKLNRKRRSKGDLKPKESSEDIAVALSKLYSAFDQAFRAAKEQDCEIDTQICSETIEQTRSLSTDPLTNKPETLALLSYMLLEYSRVPAMIGVRGQKRELKYQDRALWDKAFIEEGLDYLNKSAEGNTVSVYHLKAAVSACHSLAKDHRSTDLKQILSLYEHYLEFNHSVEIALERAEVIASFKGARAEIKAIEEIIANYASDTEHCLFEKLGDLHSRLHEYKEALKYYEIASRQAQSKTDKAKFKKKIQYCKMRLNYKKKYALGLSF